MADAPRVSPQAGKGGAELPAMGALLRHLQTQVAKAGDGAPVSAVAGVAATGTITISGEVSADDTITVGETTLTFVESGAGEGEVNIGVSAGATRDNLLAALQAIAAGEGVAVAASSTAAITVTALEKGTAGNAIALAKSSDGVTVTGSGTLAGGVDQVKGTAAPAGSIRVGGGKAYIAVADTTETDTSGWKEITLA